MCQYDILSSPVTRKIKRFERFGFDGFLCELSDFVNFVIMKTYTQKNNINQTVIGCYLCRCAASNRCKQTVCRQHVQKKITDRKQCRVWICGMFAVAFARKLRGARARVSVFVLAWRRVGVHAHTSKLIPIRQPTQRRRSCGHVQYVCRRRCAVGWEVAKRTDQRRFVGCTLPHCGGHTHTNTFTSRKLGKDYMACVHNDQFLFLVCVF